MKILGLQEMKGTSKATGKPYDSVVVYVSEERDGVVGVLTDSVWVPREVWDAQIGDVPDDALLGLEIFPSYNRRGYLQHIEMH